MALTQVNSEGIKDGEIKNADMADDAVGVAELSATGTASSSTFLRGDNSWVTPTDTNTQLAFANDANNRVVTGDGSGGLNGEANLTFDGSTLLVKNAIKVEEASGSEYYLIATNSYGGLEFQNETTKIAEFTDANTLELQDNLKFAVAGKGIDFSAQTASSATGATTGDELLDHYEEGDWTPVIRTSASATSHTLHDQYGKYTRIGRLVHCSCYCRWSAYSGSGYMMMQGLPFTAHNSTAGGSNGISFSSRANWGYQNAGMIGLVGTNSTNAYFYYSDANGTHHIQVGATQSTGDVNMSFTYFV